MAALDKFGQFIVAKLRDRAFEQYEILEKGGWKTPSLQSLQDALGSLEAEQKNVVRRCVFDAIDTALHDVLVAFQEAHDLEMGIEVLVDGENVAELSGMLHGELFGEEGWIVRYSGYPPKSEA
jgi:hypothetical protein